ncbi:substrate-binding periplasmic protein [Roseateles sp. DC23W]|uniref:Substrate-binding periplasmic protein n=1 Tax=Pelomonas dachongensis TaxID=3299029 RepID=A0ABW7EP25_9BURK
MRLLPALLLALAGALPCQAATPPAPAAVQVVTIPYMEREAPHRVYADRLLALALSLSSDRYGPYRLEQQKQESVIRRQLLELEPGGTLSVAVAMPSAEWLERARAVRFPLMKGLSSFRFFLGSKANQPLYDGVHHIEDLKRLSIGQSPGWSTIKPLQDSGFRVGIGGAHATLIPMLQSGRFQLLMRSVFEVGPELQAHQRQQPDLMIVDDFTVFTYMPMYYFVARDQPRLAERIEYGLKLAHASGKLDRLFVQYFGASLALLKHRQLKVFRIPNTNIDPGFFQRDRPFLLDAVIAAELSAAPGTAGAR